MANTAGFCNSAKVDALKALVPAADTIKAAIYLSTATINASTTAYTATGEIAATGDYAAGGKTVTHATDAALNGTEAVWTPTASVALTGVTFTGADCVLLHNASQSNRAISVHTFGSATVTGGNFTLTMPANTAGNALVRIT